LLAITPCASAHVFQWVDAEGRTQFSDRPRASVESTNDASATTALAAGDEDLGTAPRLGPYAGFAIVAPRPDQTLRQSQNNLDVRLHIDPPVIAGQQLEFVLDGTAVPTEPAAGTQFTLTGMTFGSHELAAQIRNVMGTIVARTPAVTFALRKPNPPGVLQ
jgi:hypothetical protein